MPSSQLHEKIENCKRDILDILRRDAFGRNYELIGMCKGALEIILVRFYEKQIVNEAINELEREGKIQKITDGAEEVYCLPEIVNSMKREGILAEKEPYRTLIRIPSVREGIVKREGREESSKRF